MRMAKRCARPSSASFLRLLFVLLRKRKIGRVDSKGLVLVNEYVGFQKSNSPFFAFAELQQIHSPLWLKRGASMWWALFLVVDSCLGGMTEGVLFINIHFFALIKKTNQKNLGGFSFAWKLHKSLIMRMAKRCARPSSASFLRLLFVLLRKLKISRVRSKGLVLVNEYVGFQ